MPGGMKKWTPCFVVLILAVTALDVPYPRAYNTSDSASTGTSLC